MTMTVVLLAMVLSGRELSPDVSPDRVESPLVVSLPRVGTLCPRDPQTVWNRRSLYRTPKVWAHPKEFDSEVTPIWLEGEAYKGRPTRCFAYYGLPAGASATNRAPAIVLVHGGLGTAYPEWVRLWVRRGYAALAVDNCGTIPVHGSDGRWMTHDAAGPHRDTQLEDPAGPVSDQWVYHAVAATMLGHSFIRSLEAVDASNVGVTGVSWGGFLACILAAADDRFAYAVPVYGCGFNAEPGALSFGKQNADEWQRLWDPCVYLQYARCPLLWVDGTNDFAFSLDRVRRSAALAPVESQFCTRLRMVHGHGAPGEAPAEIAAFADFYAKGGPDIVRVKEARVADGMAVVTFAAAGRKVVRAELLWTSDGSAVPWPKRDWRSDPVECADFASGRLAVQLPRDARECVVNLISADGLIASTPVLRQTIP